MRFNRRKQRPSGAAGSKARQEVQADDTSEQQQQQQPPQAGGLPRLGGAASVQVWKQVALNAATNLHLTRGKSSRRLHSQPGARNGTTATATGLQGNHTTPSRQQALRQENNMRAAPTLSAPNVPQPPGQPSPTLAMQLGVKPNACKRPPHTSPAADAAPITTHATGNPTTSYKQRIADALNQLGMSASAAASEPQTPACVQQAAQVVEGKQTKQQSALLSPTYTPTTHSQKQQRQPLDSRHRSSLHHHDRHVTFQLLQLEAQHGPKQQQARPAVHIPGGPIQADPSPHSDSLQAMHLGQSAASSPDVQHEQAQAAHAQPLHNTWWLLDPLSPGPAMRAGRAHPHLQQANTSKQGALARQRACKRAAVAHLASPIALSGGQQYRPLRQYNHTDMEDAASPTLQQTGSDDDADHMDCVASFPSVQAVRQAQQRPSNCNEIGVAGQQQDAGNMWQLPALHGMCNDEVQQFAAGSSAPHYPSERLSALAPLMQRPSGSAQLGFRAQQGLMLPDSPDMRPLACQHAVTIGGSSRQPAQQLASMLSSPSNGFNEQLGSEFNISPAAAYGLLAPQEAYPKQARSAASWHLDATGRVLGDRVPVVANQNTGWQGSGIDHLEPSAWESRTHVVQRHWLLPPG